MRMRRIAGIKHQVPFCSRYALSMGLGIQRLFSSRGTLICDPDPPYHKQTFLTLLTSLFFTTDLIPLTPPPTLLLPTPMQPHSTCPHPAWTHSQQLILVLVPSNYFQQDSAGPRWRLFSYTISLTVVTFCSQAHAYTQ